MMQYLQMYHAKINAGDAKDSVFATVASGRDPNKAFGSQLVFDGLATLRTNHSDVWLLPSPPQQHVYGVNGRKVTLPEKCRMLGVCPGTVRHVTDASLEQALGNCIAVQSMAVVLGTVAKAWMIAQRQMVSDMFFDGSSWDDEDEREDSEDKDSEEKDSGPAAE